MNRYCARLWKKHAFDLGVVCIAAVLGFAFLFLLVAMSAVSNRIAKFELPSVNAILLIFPEDQTVAMAGGGVVGLMVVIGGYSEVSRIRTMVGMASVTLGLVLAMAGIVALLLPHLTLMSTLNGPSHSYAGGGDSYWLDDSMWGIAAVGMVVSALLLKRQKVDRRDVGSFARLVIDMGVVLSVIAFSWFLLRLMASSEVILEIGLGGQKLPYITQQVMWFFPNGVIGRTIVIVCAGIATWIGLARKPFGPFPRYFSAIALALFLLSFVILTFLVVPYYQAYAAEAGASGA